MLQFTRSEPLRFSNHKFLSVKLFYVNCVCVFRDKLSFTCDSATVGKFASVQQCLSCSHSITYYCGSLAVSWLICYGNRYHGFLICHSGMVMYGVKRYSGKFLEPLFFNQQIIILGDRNCECYQIQLKLFSSYYILFQSFVRV